MAYSMERRAAVLKQLEPSNAVPLRQLAKGEGISEATLNASRRDARSKGLLLPAAAAEAVADSLSAVGLSLTGVPARHARPTSHQDPVLPVLCGAPGRHALRILHPGPVPPCRCACPDRRGLRSR